MTPIEAADLAAELAEHMMTLAELDVHPMTNAAQIEQRRQLAQECSERLTAYLLLSDSFGGL